MRHIGIPEFTILSPTSHPSPFSLCLSLFSFRSFLLGFFLSSFTLETTRIPVSLPAACFGTGATPKMSSYVIEYRLCVESPPRYPWLVEDVAPRTTRIGKRERLGAERAVNSLLIHVSLSGFLGS